MPRVARMPGRSLADVEADLAAAYAARREVLTQGVAIAGDGASRTHTSLGELDKHISRLEAEREAFAGNGGGLVFMPTMGGG